MGGGGGGEAGGGCLHAEGGGEERVGEGGRAVSGGGVGGAGQGSVRGGVGGRCCDGGRKGGAPVSLAFSLSLVDLVVPLALVAAGELASALGASERLLSGVRADVRGQVVTAAKASHADAALERLLAGVHAHVTRQLVGPGEAAPAAVGGAGVRALVRRSLALPAHGGLPDSTGLGELVGGAVRLRLDLRGEGFDGGQWRELRVRGLRQHGVLVPVQTQIVVLLRQEVVREQLHRRGGRLQPGGGVGRGGAVWLEALGALLRVSGGGGGVRRGGGEDRGHVSRDTGEDLLGQR